MPRNVIALTLLLSAGAPTAALTGTAQLPILNGELDTTDDFSSAGALVVRFVWDYGGGPVEPTQVVCTASLIAPDVALTAAHCVAPAALGLEDVPPEDLDHCLSFEPDLLYMRDDQYGGAPPLPDDAVCASGWTVHPDFDHQPAEPIFGCGRSEDLALLFLDQEVADRTPAWLPSSHEAEAIEVGLEVDIVGYGQRVFDGDWEDIIPGLRHHAASFVNELGEFEMQIGDTGSEGRKGHGDSGGPTFAAIGAGGGGLRQIGVTSHAWDGDSGCQTGGVDTRVDRYLDWIDAEMVAACDAGLRTACDPPGIRWAPVAQEDDPDGSAGCQDCRSELADRGDTGSGLLLILLVLARRRRG